MATYQVKQSSTAYPLVFLLVQSSDHITGLTGASPTVTLSKSGAAFTSPAGAVTEIGSGWYKVAGNATDSATLGPLALHATATSGDPCDELYEVVAVDPQSTAFGLSLAKTTNITGFNDIAATAVVSAGAITTSSGAVSNVTTVGTLTTYTGNTPQTGDNFARIGATGSGLTSLAPSATALSTTQWTNARAVKIDFLDVAVSTRLATAGYTVPPTTAQIATAIYTDTTASDFTTLGSPGKILVAQLGGAFTTTSSSIFSTAALANAPGGGGGVVLTSAGLDAVVIETGLNARQALSIVAAACSGLGGDTSGRYKGAGVATDRIIYTTASGERTSVTLSPPA